MARGDLESIYARIEADPFWDHLRGPGIRLVPGFGPYAPEAMVVGEAPGATENTRLRPFCGASGRVLQDLMAVGELYAEDRDIGDDAFSDTVRANAFLTNVVKYHPLGNRTPTREETEHGVPALRAEWKALGGPRLIVAVGNVAQAALRVSGFTRGQPVETRTEGVIIWPMYHPAFAMRHKAVRREVEGHWEELAAWRSR